jgi:DNA-binding transcriptional LysR family regulator
MSQLRRLLPSLNTLVAFEAVMRCGTFASAAKELGITGPAVSRTIGRLELHLGLPLFDRTPTGAVPTRDGNELFSCISRSFGELEGTLARLTQRVQPKRKPIVLSVSSAFATHWFMPKLARFQACFPHDDVRFELISGPLAGPAGDADIAMRFDHRPEPHEHVVFLTPEIIVPVAAPGLTSLEVLADNPQRHLPQLITLEEGAPLSPWSIRPHSKELRFSDYSLVIQAALVGQGIALGWLNVVSHLLAQGELVPASSRAISTERQCGLVLRRRMLSSVVEDVCQWIVRELDADMSRLRASYPELARELG